MLFTDPFQQTCKQRMAKNILRHLSFDLKSLTYDDIDEQALKVG